MKHYTITLEKVDKKLLEKQRKILGELSLSINIHFSETPRKKVILVPVAIDEAEALSGIVNMLDAWSDEEARG